MIQNTALILGNDIGKLESFDKNKLFIVNRYLGMEVSNVEVTAKVDKWSTGGVGKDILIAYLFLKINKKKKFIKYLKRDKEDLELNGYVKQYYGFSGRELEFQKGLINFEDKSFLKELSIKLGWDRKVCRKFGVAWKEPKKEKLKIEEQKSKSLFDF